MSYVYLETERFIIRQWKLDDIAALWKIMSDIRVHRFTGDTPWTLERTDEYIQFMLDQNFCTLELFHRACILKDSQTLVGLTGLNPYLQKQPEIEWQFGVQYWGKGYATEIGKAVITSAFTSTDILAIYGMADPLNLGSIRVMEKIGMTGLGPQVFRGKQDLFFRIDRSGMVS